MSPFSFNGVFRLLASISVLVAPTAAYNLSFYSGKCRGQLLGKVSGGPELGCRTTYAGNAASILAASTGTSDDRYMVVLFRSNDCDPDTEISHGDEDDDCIEGSFGSYEIWNLFD